MPLPLDLHGIPELRVMRQLAEALVYEGLVDCAVSRGGGKARFEWRCGGASIRCEGSIGAFGRVRIAPETIVRGCDGPWRPATLGDLLASINTCPER
ncbi:MAG: rhizobactin siderophore biosynthesis protein RhsF, partial [Mesorhizobium sp.]